MFFLKIATFLLVALAVGAEKKIELQDIEEDNLRSEIESEKEKEVDKSDSPQSTGALSGPGFNSLDFMKSGLLRYFDGSVPLAPQQQQQPQQQQRYVHQYAVTEQPERNAQLPVRPQYGPPAAQQAMVGYLSNIPMQIYLVPQYYSDQSDQSNQQNVRAQYQPQVNPVEQYQQPALARVAGYQPNPDAVQSNYIDVPAYVPPTAKPYVQHYPQQVTYVTYPTQPTATQPQATVAPVVAYQIPVIQFNPAVASPPSAAKPYYHSPEYADSNTVDEVSTHENDQKHYSQTESPYVVPTAPEFPRHYNSRTPIRDEYRHHGIPELPYPNPLLLKPPPPHLSHLPKTLPIHRPFLKPYQGNTLVPTSFTPRPHEFYGPPTFKRRPSSLLDSYIPSSLQVEYLKRGLVKEPLHAYDAVASGRLPHTIPRHYERGFLPNQMYHTGAGGVTYGHYKRAPKSDRTPQK